MKYLHLVIIACVIISNMLYSMKVGGVLSLIPSYIDEKWYIFIRIYCVTYHFSFGHYVNKMRFVILFGCLYYIVDKFGLI